MRFSIVYYLLLLYLTVVFQPLIPICCDALAHAFEDDIHLATVHAKYGDNHLETTLAENASENENNKNQSAVKAEDQFSVHFAEDEYDPILPVKNLHNKYSVANLSDLLVTFIAKPFPPPKLFQQLKVLRNKTNSCKVIVS